MPRKKSVAFPESNEPVSQDTYRLIGGITMEDLRRIMSETLDEAFDKYNGLKPEYLKEKNTNQRLAGLEHDARQPPLTMKIYVKPDTKTRKRT